MSKGRLASTVQVSLPKRESWDNMASSQNVSGINYIECILGRSEHGAACGNSIQCLLLQPRCTSESKGIQRYVSGGLCCQDLCIWLWCDKYQEHDHSKSARVTGYLVGKAPWYCSVCSGRLQCLVNDGHHKTCSWYRIFGGGTFSHLWWPLDDQHHNSRPLVSGWAPVLHIRLSREQVNEARYLLSILIQSPAKARWITTTVLMTALAHLDSRVACILNKKCSNVKWRALGYTNVMVGFWSFMGCSFIGALLAWVELCMNPTDANLAVLNGCHLLFKHFAAGASMMVFGCSVLEFTLENSFS